MPFPGSALFPGANTFPGAPPLAFYTPTVDVPSRMEGGLYALLPWAKSVYRIAGQWHTEFAPKAADVAAADRFYGGGRTHIITEDERAELVAGGFTHFAYLEDRE